MGADLLLLSGASDLGALLPGGVSPGAVANLAHWAVAFTVLVLMSDLDGS